MAYVDNMNTNSLQVVFTDETWIFAKGRIHKSWQDSSVKSVKNKSSSEGKRFIVLHAGSANGFIPGASLIFCSKSKSADYHDSMNSESFEKWLKEMLIPNLQEPSLVIMDNASYHSRVIEKQPSSQWNKADIAQWLNQNNIPFPQTSLKSQLLAIAKENKKPKKYVVDDILRENGHEILRLPPYHCHFNAIELIWANTKKYYDNHIGPDGFSDEQVLKMWEEALHQCGEAEWRKCVQHTENLIQTWRQRETVVNNVQPLIINVGGESSDSEIPESDSESESQ